MLFSFSIKLRSWWCLFFFLIWFSIISSIFSEGNAWKFVRNEKDFRFICVSENSWKAGAKQANWYNEVFGWVIEFNDIWWLHFCHAFSLPCLHCQFCLLCHSPTGSMLLESPRNPIHAILHGHISYSFCSSDLELLQVMNTWKQPVFQIVQTTNPGVRLLFNACLFKKSDGWCKFSWVKISVYWSLALLKAGMQSSLQEMHMLIVSLLVEKNGFFCINNLVGQLLSSCTRLAGIDYILS